MRKKILGIITFIILICCFSFVYAAEGDVTLTSSNSTVKEGDTFTITVAAKNNAGLNGIDAKVEYDDNILELVESKLSDTTNWSEYDSFPKLTAMWKTSGSDTKSANIYEIKFKVKNIGTNKSTSIKLTDIKLSLNSTDDITLSDITKTITLQTSSNNESPGTDAPKPSSSNNPSKPSNNSSNNNGANSGSNQSTQGKSEVSSRNQSNGGTKTTSQVAAAEPITTKATEDIPKTGTSIISIFIKILIVLMIVITVIFYRKCKKYIDI